MIDSNVQRLLDIEAIKALKARYCWYCDDPEKYHLFPELFTEDAFFVEEPFDPLEGKPAIIEWNDLCAKEVAWSRHYAVTPLIEVDGDTGTGRWQAILFSLQRTKEGGEQMLWASGTYQEEYRRVDGDWLFSKIHAAGRWLTNFEEGFVEELAIQIG